VQRRLDMGRARLAGVAELHPAQNFALFFFTFV
jgi:hypothetical protein